MGVKQLTSLAASPRRCTADSGGRFEVRREHLAPRRNDSPTRRRSIHDARPEILQASRYYYTARSTASQQLKRPRLFGRPGRDLERRDRAPSLIPSRQSCPKRAALPTAAHFSIHQPSLEKITHQHCCIAKNKKQRC
uniref:Uncharacterized protein n=1 Tax=Plectus sambesii TaxID=2011161 RepID=A0A914WDU0_9BILA